MAIAPTARTGLGGEIPLEGISAYARSDPRPHWHLVTYGLTDLHTKGPGDADTSGWGFEFTLRAVREASEEQPPGWALELLAKLARYVERAPAPFAPGHTMPLAGSIGR